MSARFQKKYAVVYVDCRRKTFPSFEAAKREAGRACGAAAEFLERDGAPFADLKARDTRALNSEIKTLWRAVDATPGTAPVTVKFLGHI